METTRKGAEFLSYANTILSQIDELESLYSPKTDRALRLNLSVPRATYISVAFTEFITGLDPKEQMDIRFKETNSMAAANDVSGGESDLGVIRIQNLYEPYFVSYLKDLKLQYESLWEFTMTLLMSKEHPLAALGDVPYHKLGGYTEIVHGDYQVPSLSFSEIAHGAGLDCAERRIYVYERGSQFDLLQRVPGHLHVGFPHSGGRTREKRAGPSPLFPLKAGEQGPAHLAQRTCFHAAGKPIH